MTRSVVVVVLSFIVVACGTTRTSAHAPTIPAQQISAFMQDTAGLLASRSGDGTCYLLDIPQAIRDLDHVNGNGLWQIKGSNSADLPDYQCQWTSGPPVGPGAIAGTVELTNARQHLPGEAFVSFPGTRWSVGYSAHVLRGTAWRNVELSSSQLRQLVDDVASNVQRIRGTEPPSGYPGLTTVFQGGRVAPPGTIGFQPNA